MSESPGKYELHANVSIEFLRKHADKGASWAMRSLALLHLKGSFVGASQQDGRMLLHVAARSSDRVAGWLLAIFYRTGQYGFERNEELSSSWRERTDKRIRSDAFLLYCHPSYQERTILRYERWKHYWENH